LRVLYHFRTRGRGAEAVHIAGIASAFERAGHEVRFSSPTGADPRAGAGQSPFGSTTQPAENTTRFRWLRELAFEVFEIGYNAIAFIRLGRTLRAASYALLYERHAFFLCAAAILLWRRNIPLVVEVNELVGDERVRRQPIFAQLARWADRLTFSVASLVVVVSPHLQRRVIAQGISPSKVLVLPNAVHHSQCILKSGETVRRELGLDRAITVGFVGWLVSWHRLELLLAAAAKLVRDGVNLHLLLVGDGPLRSELVQQAAALGLGDRLTITGPVPHAEVPEYIAAFDIAVIPHSNEYRSPIKLFEYLAQARAIVAPATEPISAVIQHEKNGLLVKPGSHAELTAALRGLVADAALRQTVGARGRADVLEHHLWDHNLEAMRKHLHSQNLLPSDAQSC
jgi:glycosyltransferase involved in cell wall biosynthesis